MFQETPSSLAYLPLQSYLIWIVQFLVGKVSDEKLYEYHRKLCYVWQSGRTKPTEETGQVLLKSTS